VRGGRGGGFGPSGGRASHVLDQNVWTHLINHLKKNKLLPVVNFVFSKKRCEEYASNLQGMDLCDAKEKSQVVIVWEKALQRLKGKFTECTSTHEVVLIVVGSDKTLPQIGRMRELLSRGIGIHHGGLLPLVKEVVEILFSQGVVKVLFATETFAMVGFAFTIPIQSGTDNRRESTCLLNRLYSPVSANLTATPSETWSRANTLKWQVVRVVEV
jgi:antiviral helicase SKI2